MKLLSPTNKKTKKAWPKYINPDAAKIFEHLEYLGYTLENIDDPDNDVVIARGELKLTLLVTVIGSWSWFNVRFSNFAPSALKDPNFFMALNNITKSTRHGMWYVAEDTEDRGVVVAIHAGHRVYERLSFGNFISTFEQEIRTNIDKLDNWLRLAAN